MAFIIVYETRSVTPLMLKLVVQATGKRCSKRLQQHLLVGTKHQRSTKTRSEAFLTKTTETIEDIFYGLQLLFYETPLVKTEVHVAQRRLAFVHTSQKEC